jgi:SNF2 family DNA or RNA helicase
LPAKIETASTVELNPEQKKIYLAYLAQMREDIAHALNLTGFTRSRIKILAALTRLRQICCHPGLFLDNYKGGSGKLDHLVELLADALPSGKRVLIFSQFTSMLAIIQDTLQKSDIPYFYLDGKTPPADRLTLARSFNQGDRPVFLISLKAGGTGLNLTGADTVILYDLWWNPAVEQQAADRAHRIGQKNVVQVIRLITRGTIEQRIFELQEAKRSLVDQVVGGEDQDLPALTEADIRAILAI